MIEKEVRKQVAEYLQMQHPDLIYRFDLSADQRLTPGQAKRNSYLHGGDKGRGFPDLIIFEPRGEYHGLFIELKSKPGKAYRKDGKIRQDEHTQRQAKFLQDLADKGYKATFGEGFEQTVEIIKKYLDS